MGTPMTKTHVLTNSLFFIFQANPGLYKSVGDGFRSIKAAEGLKGFTLVSISILYKTNDVMELSPHI
jgi:hypothetical protein